MESREFCCVRVRSWHEVMITFIPPVPRVGQILYYITLHSLLHKLTNRLSLDKSSIKHSRTFDQLDLHCLLCISFIPLVSTD